MADHLPPREELPLRENEELVLRPKPPKELGLDGADEGLEELLDGGLAVE